MPVFIFSLVLLIYLLKVMHFQEIIHFESCKNLAALSWESQLGGAGFGERMFESRVYHDVQDKVSKEINISAEVEANGEVYIADISYPIDINVPFGLFDDIKIRDVLISRKWSGKMAGKETSGFAFMEQEDTADYVYVFPRYGERYHKGTCTHLSYEGRYFESLDRTEALSKGYLGCEVCY
ncbi:MAG: hypothetical protein IJC41_03140 [Firmicutes bacterium]|nr:hypothetical protein [Bacillota bacterium]